MQIYIHHNGQQLGPFTEAEVKAQLASGAISAEDHCWWEGQANWTPLKLSPLLVSAFEKPPVPPASPLIPLAGSAATPGMPTVTYAESVALTRTSNQAIWSLVCSLFGLFCCCISSVVGIVLGHLALAEIKQNPAIEGKGMALAGVIIGYIAIVLNIFGFIFGFMFNLYDLKHADTFKMIEEKQAVVDVHSPKTAPKDDATTSDTNAAPVEP